MPFLAIALAMLNASPADAASVNLVCHNADRTVVWIDNGHGPNLTVNGVAAGAAAKLSNESLVKEEELAGSCSLGSPTYPVVERRKYEATLELVDRKVPVLCHEVINSQLPCSQEFDEGGL